MGGFQGGCTYSEFLQYGFEKGIVFGEVLEDLIIMTTEVDEYGERILGYRLS